MRIFDGVPPRELEQLRQLLSSISAEEKAAAEARARATALQARIDQADDVARQLQGKVVNDPYHDVDRGELAKRILAGETIADGVDDVRARLHHNSIVMNEVQRQRDLASSLREEQRHLSRDATAAHGRAVDLREDFRHALLQVAFNAAEGAVRDLIRDFLLPLYAMRAQCHLGRGQVDSRVGVVFDQTMLWTLHGTTMVRQWPPFDGLVIPTFPKLEAAAVEQELIAALGAAPNSAAPAGGAPT